MAKEPPPEAPTAAAAAGGGFKFPVAATAAAANGTDHKRSLTSVSPAAERRKHEIEQSREARRRLRESTSSAVGAAALSKTAAPSPLSHSPPPTADASSSSATTAAKPAASWYGLRRIGSKSANYISMGVERRAEALSEQDAAFVLDTRNVVFVWIGAKCEQARGRKAVVLAQLLAQEGQADGSKSKVGMAVLDYARVVKPSAPSHDDEERFWQDFDGSSRKQHARPHKGTAEEEAVVAKNKELDGQLLSLFIVNCSASGRPDVSGHPLQKLSRQYLTSDKSFLVDDQVDVWVWSGRYSDTQSRNWAWQKAVQLCMSSKRDEANIRWVLDTQEPVYFKDRFYDWLDPTWAYTDKQERKRKQELAEEEERQQKAARELLLIFEEMKQEQEKQQAAQDQQLPPTRPATV